MRLRWRLRTAMVAVAAIGLATAWIRRDIRADLLLEEREGEVIDRRLAHLLAVRGEAQKLTREDMAQPIGLRLSRQQQSPTGRMEYDSFRKYVTRTETGRWIATRP